MTLNQAHKKSFKRQVVSEGIKTVERKIVPRITAGMNAAWIISLKDEFGFGEKRLNRILEKVNLQFEALYEKYATVEELQEVILEELGIDLREVK